MKNSHETYKAQPSTYAGVWFRDLDSNAEVFRLLSQVSDATILHDGQTVLDVRAANHFLGCSPDDLIGRPISEVLKDVATEKALQSHEISVWCHGRPVKLVALRSVRSNKRDKRSNHTGMDWIAESPPEPSHPLTASPMILGIAHDLNGMLTTILTGLNLLERQGMDATVHNYAVEACRRAATLVSELLSVGVGATPDFPLTHLENAIQRGVTLAIQGTSTDVTLEIDEGLWPVCADESRFERVIYNLALNAVQAMPDGGELLVKAKNTYVHQPSRSGSVAGRAVRVSVRDTGPGIPSSALAKIFEPYFTTKREGMGIGLAASRDLVLETGGDITVECSAERGTTFHVFMPAGIHTDPPPPPPLVEPY